MPRYQFEIRAYPIAAFEKDKARDAARKHGATHIRECHPMILKGERGGPNAKYWRGTNQPKTIAFTARNDGQAAYIAESYNMDIAFVWNITDQHYV